MSDIASWRRLTDLSRRDIPTIYQQIMGIEFLNILLFIPRVRILEPMDSFSVFNRINAEFSSTVST